MKIGKLTFRELDVHGRASIASDLTDSEARGIYAYEFEDGDWYVGKATDVRARHVQHAHEYKHKDPAWVPIKMLWMPVKGTDDELDNTETMAIAAFESQGCSLKNIQKANRPRGNDSVRVFIDGKWGVVIPWERRSLPASTKKYRVEKNPKMREKFEKLKRRDDYDFILASLARYVHKTVPAPAETAGKLWTATAYPSTLGRICCISCQNVQTFLFLQGRRFGVDGPFAAMTVKPAEGLFMPHPDLIWYDKSEINDYSNLPNSFTLDFYNYGNLDFALNSSMLLDCCYRANAELMRKGPAMFKAHNNPYLVDAILKCKDFDTTEFRDPIALRVADAFMRGERDDVALASEGVVFPKNLKMKRV